MHGIRIDDAKQGLYREVFWRTGTCQHKTSVIVMHGRHNRVGGLLPAPNTRVEWILRDCP